MNEQKKVGEWGEPWVAHMLGGGKSHRLNGNRYSIRKFGDDGSWRFAVAVGEREEVKRAIVCVNALQGIADPQAFMGAVQELEKYISENAKPDGYYVVLAAKLRAARHGDKS